MVWACPKTDPWARALTSSSGRHTERSTIAVEKGELVLRVDAEERGRQPIVTELPARLVINGNCGTHVEVVPTGLASDADTEASPSYEETPVLPEQAKAWGLPKEEIDRHLAGVGGDVQLATASLFAASLSRSTLESRANPTRTRARRARAV